MDTINDFGYRQAQVMKITDIKQQIKNSERVSIYIDGKYGFSLSLDELLEQKIKINQEIDEAKLKKLQKISSDGKLRARALEWTFNRPRSAREFRDYLRRKKAEPEITEKLLTDFLKKGYLDEVKFANWLVEVRATAGKSNRAISAELASKGIEREIAESALKNAETSEDTRLKAVLGKKSKIPRYQKDHQKLVAYLARQGFSYDLIKKHFLERDFIN